jgi:hypothetical protein
LFLRYDAIMNPLHTDAVTGAILFEIEAWCSVVFRVALL